MPPVAEPQPDPPSAPGPVYRLVSLFAKVLFGIFGGGFLLLGGFAYLTRDAPPRIEPKTPLDIKRDYVPWVQPYAQWEKGGFGRVLIAKIAISNQGDRPVKDVTLKCTLYGKSGTAIESKAVTVYEAIGPRQTTDRVEHNLGFITGQEDSMTCETVNFEWAQ